ncbi:unnamed protein product [Bursaphelenchus okinawaensis]|uniref:Uncharacterized protein n=1 Tax=Bursaphelenchus okinawaensis TaxID=465554 RepID=A0A811K9Q4_9BILA|nr:unnamed protein product [Bursaphelenchus okinawaensis]CAG9097626.1 unnamed protein product [Bursaphelenchus okinawaensis]
MAVIKQNNVFDLIEKLCVMEAELELGGPLAENWQQIEFSAMNQQPEDVEQDEDEEIDVIGISDEENVVDVQVYDNIEIEEENEAADMGRFNNVIIVDDDPDVINIDNVNISDLILEGSDEELAHQELIEFLEDKNEEYLMIPRRRYRQGTPDTENNIDGNSEEEHFTNGSSDSESDDDFVDWKRLQNLVNRPKRTLKKVKNPILMKKKNVALRKERYRMLQMALEKLDGK